MISIDLWNHACILVINIESHLCLGGAFMGFKSLAAESLESVWEASGHGFTICFMGICMSDLDSCMLYLFLNTCKYVFFIYF